ncbi:hypothetical protein [Variibacter gotjawalensis]|uniref:hypothetical protein n=1 Tax=Variibacter gotjawalensis TaxID=1333996 RepID=UPI0012FE4586|nr:hypothetical protein [Variibacter gotjawalensis]NIK47676.1 hypothetical protein [Variibacter gotjawalensis]
MLKLLIGQRAAAQKAFLQGCATALVLSLWIASQKAAPGLEISISTLKLVVPSVYVLFVIAGASLAAAINGANYLIVSSLFPRLSRARFGGADPAILLDASNAWSDSLLPQFRFYKSGRWQKFWVLVTLVVVMMPLMTIALIVYSTAVPAAFKLAFQTDQRIYHRVIAVAALVMFTYPAVLIVLYSKSFRFHRNASFIRWLFLFRVYRRSFVSPATVNSWEANVARWVAEPKEPNQGFGRLSFRSKSADAKFGKVEPDPRS